MEILKNITAVVISIMVFGGPQLHTVDAIKISNEINLSISEDIKL